MQSRVFDVSVRHAGGESIIACSGELDIVSTERLDEAFGSCIGREPESVTVDCARVSFVDSSGIRTLVGIARRCTEGGIELRVRASEQLQKISDLLGVSTALGITEGNEKAPQFPGAARGVKR